VVTFTPHLIPMTRGIFSTSYAMLRGKSTTEDVLQVYRECYAGSPFVTVLDAQTIPHTKWCYGSNRAFLTARVDARTGRVITLSAIDNLGKGMAGQAIQNMNILCGLPEETGLQSAAVYP
jgi:N-acetyl-gamma-glutamyl-phosphate reductase